MSVKQGDETWRRKPFFLDGWPNGQALPPRWYPLQLWGCYHGANRRAPGGGNHKISRLPQAAEYQEVPQGENYGFVYRSMLSVPRYSMGLKLTTRDPENFGLLILKVADGTAGSLLVFFEHWLMSFHSPCDARY